MQMKSISHLYSMNLFENRRILITGASRGLGLVCARAFSREGARLVLMARSKEDLENACKSCENPEKHLPVPVDLVNKEDIKRSVGAAKRFLSEIDVVLHVAGGGLGLKDTLIKKDDLLKLFSLNIGAAAEINRLVAPDMIKRKKGNLVHVCSIASAEATGSVGYNTAKAALAAYVRTLGNELMRHDVIATGILPGGFLAPENAMERLRKNKPDVFQTFIEERLPRKRMGTAEEIIPLIAFLCSQNASMMGGCLVPIDAGEGKIFLQNF